MNWYSKYKKEWKEIIETISTETSRTFYMIEKDTIQSMFLYELSKCDFPFVFKGGTSLSKAYNLIERFSEDIDLSSNKKLTSKDKKKSYALILEIGEKLGLTLYNSQDVKSGYDYNKYIFKYNSLLNNLQSEIIVETSYYQPVYPTIEHSIHSIVGIFCEKQNIQLPIPFKEVEFKMNVQSLERTFVDKVFAVCDYKLQNMMDRDSRHLYDIAKIYPHISIDDDFKKFIKLVRADRIKSKNNPSAKEQYNINELLKDIIETRFFEKDYNFLTTKLLYEEYSYDLAVINGIDKVRNLNIF